MQVCLQLKLMTVCCLVNDLSAEVCLDQMTVATPHAEHVHYSLCCALHGCGHLISSFARASIASCQSHFELQLKQQAGKVELVEEQMEVASAEASL